MQEQFNRFKDAPWFPKDRESVLIGGAGGIGSWLTFFLARIGFSPIVYDFDTIEEHNLGGQLFRKEDVNKLKVLALADITRSFCNTEITTFTEKIDLDSPTHYFMFSAFDNMKARKDAFEVWKRSIPNCPVTPIFIDGRLELEQLQIFAVTPNRIAEYEAHLFDDSQVEDLPCTLKQSSHTAAMIASHMVGTFTNHITNLYTRRNIRSVPFYYEFYTPMALTTLND
jgi:hypothetical protein